MTIDFSTASAGIFARLGKLFGVWDRVETFQSDIVDASGSSLQEAINAYIPVVGTAGGSTVNTDLEMATQLMQSLDGLRNTVGTAVWGRLLATARLTLVEMVNADVALPAKNVTEALKELRTQMKGSSKYLDATTITIGSTTKSTANTGDVIINVDPDKLFHSDVAQYPTVRTEKLIFRCTADSSGKNISSGGETFRLEAPQPFPPSDHRWPGGTGLRRGLISTSDNTNDGRVPMRNILRNSNFEKFDSGTPKAWRVATGSANTHVVREATTVANGKACMKMASNGSTLIRVDQKLGSLTGTPSTLPVDSVVAISCLARKGGTSSSAGNLRIGFAQSDGTALTNSTFDTAHGSISDSAWTQLTHSFRLSGTDLALPSELYFMVQQATAFTSGTNLFIDRLVCCQMWKSAPGGFSCAIVPGSVDFKVGDTLTVQITNNNEGTMSAMLDRFFDCYHRDVFFPSKTDGSETEADTLIS